nr:MAG TPA: hypothetical protein [Caudoviricetes sp.]
MRPSENRVCGFSDGRKKGNGCLKTCRPYLPAAPA